MTLRRLFRHVAATAIALGMATAVAAQSPFSAAVEVNDRVVTYHEIEQRALLLRVMRLPGDTKRQAYDQLVNERLQQGAAANLGIQPSEEGLQFAFEQFASRVNLSVEELVKALAQEGIDEQTARDFVAAQVLWSGVVQTRFGGSVQISEEEIDRAIASNVDGGINVLLSEIVIPVTPQNFEEVNGLAIRLSEIRSTEEFENAARQYSQSSTKANGGHIDWMSVTKLPPELRPMIATLGPGEVTDPVQLPNAVALFQMRAKSEAARPAPRYAAIDYAMYFMPGGRSPETLAEARKLRDRIDRCDDLYGEAYGKPPELLERTSLPPGKIPNDIGVELAKLDSNEVSTNLTTAGGENLIFLMLCGRTAELAEEEVSREDVARALRSQRLESFAASYLEQLRADATIVEK